MRDSVSLVVPGDSCVEAPLCRKPAGGALPALQKEIPMDGQTAAGLGQTPGPSGGHEDSQGAIACDCHWPESERANLYAVEGCESRHGQDAGTYDLSAENGGILQINRPTWEGYFLETCGWDWAQIVTDDTTNYRAACLIWERNGWADWSCRP